MPKKSTLSKIGAAISERLSVKLEIITAKFFLLNLFWDLIILTEKNAIIIEKPRSIPRIENVTVESPTVSMPANNEIKLESIGTNRIANAKNKNLRDNSRSSRSMLMITKAKKKPIRAMVLIMNQLRKDVIVTKALVSGTNMAVSIPVGKLALKFKSGIITFGFLR